MKSTSVVLLLWLILLVPSNHLLAQTAERVSLQTYLSLLEERFEVTFSFADENVRGVEIQPPLEELPLDTILGDLQSQTGLTFEELDHRYIAIRLPDEEYILSGIIKDGNSGETLEGAHIFTQRKSTTSDQFGKFSLKINRNVDSLMIISYTGFTPLELTSEKWHEQGKVYDLQPDIIAMEEVVVNYLVKGLEKLPDGTIVLKPKGLEIMPGLTEPDILYTIQALPGIQSVTESVSNINTRGGTNDQTLVLWEDVKMYQTGHFFGLVSAFNSHLIQNTRIIKNGSSSRYAEGVSGIIDMKLQDSQVKKLTVEGGTTLISSDAIVSTPLWKDASLILSARHSINDLIATPTYNSYYTRAFEHTEVFQNPMSDTLIGDTQDFSFHDLSLKFIYDPTERDHLSLSLLRVYNSISHLENATLIDTIYNNISELDQSSTLAGATYAREWSDKHTTRISGYFSGYLMDGINASTLDFQDHLQQNEVLDWGLKMQWEYIPGENSVFLSGYQFTEVGVRNLDNINRPDYFREEKDVLRIHSIFSEFEMPELVERLYMRVGVRASFYPEFSRIALEPRAALNFSLTEHFRLQLLTERKHQFTTQLIDFQTDFLGIEKRRWALSNNSTIPLIQSDQLSLGMQYSRSGFLFSAEGYLKKIDGIISPSQGFQNQFQYEYALGDYNSKGLEFLINKRFPHSNYWMNYTLANSTYAFMDFTPGIFPSNYDIRHLLSIGTTYSIGQLDLALGFNYHSGKPHTLPQQTGSSTLEEIVFELPNSSNLPDYFRLDISTKYTFELDKISGEVGIAVWNLLNRKNVLNTYYVLNSLDEMEEITQHALKFTPNMNLRVFF